VIGQVRTETAGLVRQLRAALVALLCLGGAVALSACGSSSSEANDGVVAPPSPPTAKNCGLADSPPRPASAAHRRQRPPVPGVYRYRTQGTVDVPSEAIRARDLSPVTELIATKPRRFGNLVCFRMQKRYAPDLATTETYVIRGSELFLVSLRIQAPGSSRAVRPEPAVLFGSSSASKWSGQFGGATSGSYSVTATGDRAYFIDGKRLKATGVRSTVTYRGAVSGGRTMTAWISPQKRLILSERVVLRERLGVSDVLLRMHRRLIGLEPSRAG
jgi:hypothetical protein